MRKLALGALLLGMACAEPPPPPNPDAFCSANHVQQTPVENGEIFWYSIPGHQFVVYRSIENHVVDMDGEKILVRQARLLGALEGRRVTRLQRRKEEGSLEYYRDLDLRIEGTPINMILGCEVTGAEENTTYPLATPPQEQRSKLERRLHDMGMLGAAVYRR